PDRRCCCRRSSSATPSRPPNERTANAGSDGRRPRSAEAPDYHQVTMSTRLPAAARREQLLGVALEVFARHGFHGTAMNDVAGAAGVTKPVLYQHFQSKRQLYLALLEEVGQRLRQTIEKVGAEAGGPRAQVERGFRAYFRWVKEDRDAFRL